MACLPACLPSLKVIFLIILLLPLTTPGPRRIIGLRRLGALRMAQWVRLPIQISFPVFYTPQVRVECISGLRRLGALRTAQWARLAQDLSLYPTPHMIHLVDKKFGGELTKADVFGVEVSQKPILSLDGHERSNRFWV